jgi:hypothetical protein
VAAILPPAAREISPVVGALLLYAVLALILTIGAWQSPSTTWAGGCCDPEQTMWFLRWGPYALSHLTDPFFTHNLSAPAGVNLMWNTPILLVSIVASPITLLFGPIVAYNVVMTAAVALSAWCAFLALRRYARGIAAPLVGGLVYGFSPYVVSQAIQHLDLAIAFVPPLFLLVLDELLVRRRRSPLKLGVALGLLAFVQFLIAEELVLTSAILGLVLVVVLALQRRSEIPDVRHRLFVALRAALVTFAVLAAWPLAVQFLGEQQVHGALQNTDAFSTDLVNLLVPTQWQLIAPSAATALSGHFSGLDLEANAYVGILLLMVLTAFVARHWGDIRVRTAAIVGIVALVLSMGPHLEIGGQSTGWPMPLLLFTKLPLIGDVQPNRLAVLMWLAIAVLVTVAIDGALRWERLGSATLRLGVLLVALLAVLPKPMPSFTVAVPVFFQNWGQEGIPDGTTILVAPFFRDGAGADPMLWAAVAGDGFRMPEAYAYVPQINGTAGYGPPATQLSSVMETIQDNGVTVVVRGAARTQVGKDLQAASIHDVIVGPMNNQRQMLAFFTDLFGRAPQQVDGVEIWRDVDSNGVSYRSTSGTGTG